MDLRDEDGIIGVVTSKRFRRKDTMQRQDLIHDILSTPIPRARQRSARLSFANRAPVDVPSAVRRVLLTAGVVILFVILIGATYQGVATALERREFPHPGRMIDIGSHQLHLYCLGQGAPAVVLEAPATTMSAAWAWVQADVGKITRVCSYDRAGLGWSEAGDAPFSPQEVPTELNALLQNLTVNAEANAVKLFVAIPESELETLIKFSGHVQKAPRI